MFQFRQFAVLDQLSAMKVNTDAILLGAWAHVEQAKTILEVGCGCGIVSLMLAQKNLTAEITGIDIDHNSIIEANENFNRSLWSKRLKAKHISFQEFASQNKDVFDIIISNPPYFDKSLLPDLSSRIVSKHTHSLNFLDIIHHCWHLLSESGKLIFIIPFDDKEKLLEAAKVKGFHTSRCAFVKTRPFKTPFRYLVELSKSPLAYQEETFSIQDDNHYFSEEYKKLTGEYHPEHFLNKRV